MNKIVMYNQATEKFELSDYVQIHPRYARLLGQHLFGMFTLEILTETERLLSEGLLKDTLDIV